MSENLMPHIRLPKDLDVDCVLLPGDPARADTVASHLADARLLASNREFRSWQGTYKGKKMLVTSTGIGAASCAIAVEELIQCGVHNLIRIGNHHRSAENVCRSFGIFAGIVTELIYR